MNKKLFSKKAYLLFWLFLFLLFTDNIFASKFTLIPPTTNEDGTIITFPDDLAYVFYCDSDTSGEPYTIRVDAGKIVPDADGKCRFPISNVLPSLPGIQKWFCAATAYYIFAPDNESRYSNEIFFVATDGAEIISVFPSAPRNLGFER